LVECPNFILAPKFSFDWQLQNVSRKLQNGWKVLQKTWGKVAIASKLSDNCTLITKFCKVA
jgi:hypothetical protein